MTNSNTNTNQDNVQPGQHGQKGSNPDQVRTDGKQSAAAADAKSDEKKSAPAQSDAAGTSRR